MYHAPRVHGRTARASQKIRFAFLAVPALLASAGCDAATALSAEELPASIQLSRSAVDFATADTTRLEAVLLGASGRPIASPSAGQAKPGTTGPAVSWQSSDRDIVEVSRSGLLQARGSGEATITASSGNLRAQADVQVRGNQRTVVVSPKVDTLTYLGDSGQLDATLFDASGKRVGGNVSWESSKPDIVTVDGRGRISAVAVGVALITATASASVDTARVVVHQVPAEVVVAPGSATAEVGQTKQFSAFAVDAGGSDIPGATMSWSSSDTKIATVDSKGVVSAKAAGKASIRATAEGVSESAAMTVTGTHTGTSPAPPASSPPAGDRPNEPVGFERWLEHDFSYLPDGQLSHAGYAAGGFGSNYSIVSDPSDPTGNGTVLRIRYPKGLMDGNSPGRFFAWDRPSQHQATPLKEWYISVWVMLEGPDWETPPSGQKFWYNGVGRKGHPSKGGIVSLHGGGPPNTIQTNWSTYTAARSSFDAVINGWSDNRTGGEKTFRAGPWVHIEFHGTLSSPGQADGTYRMWRDGVLVNERLNVQNQHPDDWLTGFYEFHWAPVWGGACNPRCPKERDDFMRVAHLYVSGVPQ